MKQIYKYFATIAVALFTSLSSFGYDVCVDGIYYDLVEKAHEATVVKGNQSYRGDIVIPATIKVEDVDYNVLSIGSYAFDNSSLTSISIPNSVTSIKWGAFRNCISLTSISIPNSVTSIEEYAFLDCYSLTSISISNSVTRIESNMFKGCFGLTSITIPNSVTSIGSSAFSGCFGLASITIPNSVTSIGSSAFYKCTSLTSITIPNSVTSIDNSAFSGCSSLTSITIPNSVTSIGSSAFYNCTSLTSISIGNPGKVNIYSAAFSNCKNLEEVTCFAENVPSMGTDVFKDSYVGYATLKVPEASIAAYKTADQWKDFGTIKAIESTGIEHIAASTPTTNKVFDISGKRLQQPAHGINIINGKKIVKK